MLNKIDNFFIITAISAIISGILSFVFLTTSFIFFLHDENLHLLITSIFFYLSILFFIILIIGILVLITTFIFKILTKNKSKKDWLILISNLFAIFMSFIAAFIMVILIFNPI